MLTFINIYLHIAELKLYFDLVILKFFLFIVL